MPTAVTEMPYRPVPTEPPRKRWTRAECAVLKAVEPWDQQRLELVDEELINEMGKNRPHVNVFTLVHAWLLQAFGAHYVNAEAPIDVAPEDNPTASHNPTSLCLPSRRGKSGTRTRSPKIFA
jgi:hypothetical protein